MRVTIEEVEQSNHSSYLNKLTIVEVRLQFIPQCFIHITGARGHNLGETQCDQFTSGEEMAVWVNMVERVYQLLAYTQLPCQGSMIIHSIITMIDLSDTNSQYFLQHGFNRP